MEKPMSRFSFKFMSLEFKIRDLLYPREKILAEAGIVEGDVVLDFGCGPGSYTIPAAEMVGKGGKVYAIDIHPLAIESVSKRAAKRNLKNITTKKTGRATGLPDGAVDIVLLYDILHHLEKPREILAELARVLKPEGVLSVSDHHLKEEAIIEKITESGRFCLEREGKRIIQFKKRKR